MFKAKHLTHGVVTVCHVVFEGSGFMGTNMSFVYYNPKKGKWQTDPADLFKPVD